MNHQKEYVLPYSQENIKLVRDYLKGRNTGVIPNDSFVFYDALLSGNRRNIFSFKVSGKITHNSKHITVTYSITPSFPIFIALSFILVSIIDGLISIIQGTGLIWFPCTGVAILGFFSFMILWQMSQCSSRFEQELYRISRTPIPMVVF